MKVAKNYYEERELVKLILQEKNKMELNFLKSQIQPHFLFNTLNNIYGLVIDNDKASQSILRLSDLLRFSLYESNKGDISLQEEVAFLSNYISLEKMRHKEDKVEIHFDFREIENLLLVIKPLLLVNFIENAFKHGVNSHVHHPWVEITLKVKRGKLTFCVTNNVGAGRKSEHDSKQKEGVGLSNVRRRLELEYPDRHRLTIIEGEDRYEVELLLEL